MSDAIATVDIIMTMLVLALGFVWKTNKETINKLEETLKDIIEEVKETSRRDDKTIRESQNEHIKSLKEEMVIRRTDVIQLHAKVEGYSNKCNLHGEDIAYIKGKLEK